MENSNTSLRRQLSDLKGSGLNASQAVAKLKAAGKKSAKPQSRVLAAMAVAFDDGANIPAEADAIADAIMFVFKGLSPLELAQLLKIYNDNVEFVAAGVIAPDGFPNMTAADLGKLLLDPTLYPSLAKADMYNTLVAVGYSAADATAAVNTIYGGSYALNITGNPSYLAAPSSNAYNFGTGDFALQCWVKTTASGTVISRKPADGGGANGGFLLVIKSDGIIKLATDNGYGFYEINTIATAVRDGNWHFLTAVRQSDNLVIYLDGNPVQASPRSNISPPVSINNNLPLLMGSVAQWQEPFQQFAGQLDEVRIWNRALSQDEIKANMNRPLTGSEQGLVGYYTFVSQNGNDSSPLKNNATPTGSISYASPGVF